MLYLLILLVLLALPCTALATEYQYNGYKFTVSGSSCTITDYVGTDTELVIPSTLKYNKKNYTVVEIGYGAFGYNTALTSVTTPSTLKVIGASAFSDCTSLSEINLNNGLTTIEYGAFEGTALTSLSLPDTVTYFDPEFDCPYYLQGPLDSLTYLKWTAGIPVMPDYFKYWPALETVVLPEGMTAIENYAFYWCDNLTSVSLPESLLTIGDEAFSGCNLQSLVLPNKLTHIGEWAFSHNSMTSVTIPGSVKTIGNLAFTQCTQLSTVTLNDGLQLLGSGAFSDTAIESLEIPDTVTSTEESSPVYGTPLKHLKWSANVPVIPDYAFELLTSLESIILPEGVTTIGFEAFKGCEALKSISLPSTLTTIDYGAFIGTGIEELYLPDTVTTFDMYEYDMPHLKTLRWTAGIPNVDMSTIKAPKLESVILPEGVISIAEYGLWGNESLTSVSLPSTLTSIGTNAFRCNRALVSITIPEGITKIPNEAFYMCSSLQSVTLPQGLQSIGDSAFRNTPITRAYLPNNLSTIYSNSFNYSTALVSMPGSATSALLKTKGIEYVSPTTLTLPADTLEIEAQAFYGSNAEMVVVPEGCTLVGSEAFANMPLLHYAVVPAGATVADDAFDGSPVLHMVEQ